MSTITKGRVRASKMVDATPPELQARGIFHNIYERLVPLCSSCRGEGKQIEVVIQSPGGPGSGQHLQTEWLSYDQAFTLLTSLHGYMPSGRPTRVCPDCDGCGIEAWTLVPGHPLHPETENGNYFTWPGGHQTIDPHGGIKRAWEGLTEESRRELVEAMTDNPLLDLAMEELHNGRAAS